MEVTRLDTGQAIAYLSPRYRVCDNTYAAALTAEGRERRADARRQQARQHKLGRRQASRSRRANR